MNKLKRRVEKITTRVETGLRTDILSQHEASDGVQHHPVVEMEKHSQRRLLFTVYDVQPQTNYQQFKLLLIINGFINSVLVSFCRNMSFQVENDPFCRIENFQQKIFNAQYNPSQSSVPLILRKPEGRFLDSLMLCTSV